MTAQFYPLKYVRGGNTLGLAESSQTDLDILGTIVFYSIVQNPEAKFVQFLSPAPTVRTLE